MNRSSNSKLAFILAVLVALGVTLVKDKKLNDVQNEIDTLEYEKEQLQDKYHSLEVNYWLLREDLHDFQDFYKYINNEFYSAKDVNVITFYSNEKENKIFAIKEHSSFSDDSKIYNSLFKDTNLIPYNVEHYIYRSVEPFSHYPYEGNLVAFDYIVSAKSDDGVYEGFYRETQMGDFLISIREIYKDGILQENLSYSISHNMKIEDLTSVLEIDGDSVFSINELMIMERRFSEENDLRLILS